MRFKEKDGKCIRCKNELNIDRTLNCNFDIRKNIQFVARTAYPLFGSSLDEHMFNKVIRLKLRLLKGASFSEGKDELVCFKHGYFGADPIRKIKNRSKKENKYERKNFKNY